MDRGGYGSDWGPFDGFADMMGDVNFNMSFRGNARNRMSGYGNGYDYYQPAYGYGYPYPYAPYPAAYYPPTAQSVTAEMPLPSAVNNAPAVETDGDGDGVFGSSDFCPYSTAGAMVDAFGCEKDAAIVLRGVNFHTDSDKLTEQSLTILDGVAATLLANPEIRVQVAGHTDSQGEDIYNKDLSERRAASVVNYLQGKGVSSDNLNAAGYGEEQPVATNDTAEGRAANRRVELVREDS